MSYAVARRALLKGMGAMAIMAGGDRGRPWGRRRRPGRRGAGRRG